MASVAPIGASEIVADPIFERRGRRLFSVEFEHRIVAHATTCQGHGEAATLMRLESSMPRIGGWRS